MLQRSPTYVVARPDRDTIADRLRKLLPDSLAYRITRRKNITLLGYFYGQTRTQAGQDAPADARCRPQAARRRDHRRPFHAQLQPVGPALVPAPQRRPVRGDPSGSASVVTDHITTFTSTGIVLESGAELEADIVVTATGLQLVTLGRDGLRGRRRAGRLRRDVHVPGRCLQRRSQPGLHVRVHQRLLDDAQRPDRSLRVPPAQPHARQPAPTSARRDCATPTATCHAARGSTASRPATCNA